MKFQFLRSLYCIIVGHDWYPTWILGPRASHMYHLQPGRKQEICTRCGKIAYTVREGGQE